MTHPQFLFAPPKQGGVVQSSGFLDLRSLMALSQTCKAHALDELSLIQSIEHELTRDHKCRTMEEAIDFWKDTYRQPLLKQWLDRDRHPLVLVVPSQGMLLAAVPYDVMFVKMLRLIPRSVCFEVLIEKGKESRSVLHRAVNAGKHELVRAIFASLPTSEHYQAVTIRGSYGMTTLHYAGDSGNMECIKTVLDLYPESKYSSVLCAQTGYRRTVLHCAARSNNFELIKFLIELIPEAECHRVVEMKDQQGKTVLDLVSAATRESIMELLSEKRFLKKNSLSREASNTTTDDTFNAEFDHMLANIDDYLNRRQQL